MKCCPFHFRSLFLPLPVSANEDFLTEEKISVIFQGPSKNRFYFFIFQKKSSEKILITYIILLKPFLLSEDMPFPWYLMKHHGNTYSKLVQSGVDDTFPEDLLDDSPWSREMVRRGKDSKDNQTEVSD